MYALVLHTHTHARTRDTHTIHVADLWVVLPARSGVPRKRMVPAPGSKSLYQMTAI